jgi:predicted GNAT family acetyltransferase
MAEQVSKSPDAIDNGGRLVTAAIDRAVRERLTLVPLCPFARDWLKRHPEAASRAAIDWDW